MQTILKELTAEDRTKIVSFLKEHPVGVLATVDAKANPQASPIYIGVEDNLTVTFTTKRETQKYRDITQHSTVMLVVYDAKSQMVVQLGGVAKEVTAPSRQQAIYHQTLRATKKTGPDAVPPVAKIPGSFVAFTITPSDIWLSDYGWGNSFAKALDKAGKAKPGGDPA